MNSTKRNSKRQIQELILPSRYSADLAEECGIHIGDGCMNIYASNNSGVYTYSGHAIDDLEFSFYVIKLMKKLYNIPPSYKRVQKNTIMLAYTRNKLIKFKNSLGLPLGPKINITIPGWIMDSESFKVSCIRGMFATDGCLSFQKKYRQYPYYPHLKITSKSKQLMSQVKNILGANNITSSLCCDARITKQHPNKIWSTHFYGVENLEKFSSKFGFINPKHSMKYKDWKSNAGCGI